MALDDHELIAQAQRGDMMAFEQLVYRYDKRVLSMAMTYSNDPEDAKDIYQEVFLRVYRALPKFQFRSQFSTWLYRIVTNVCLTHQSRHKQHAYASLDEGVEDEDANPHSLSDTLADNVASDEYTVNAEIAMHVQEAMNALSPQQRMVFTLRHYDGYKLKEIAEMMDCAEGTVKKYLFTATERMRERLKDVFE